MSTIKRRLDFVKTKIKEFRKACRNFVAKIKIHGPVLGWDEARIASETALIDNLMKLFDEKDQMTIELAAKTKELTVKKADYIAHIRTVREEVRGNPACNEAMWVDLGFETTYSVVDTMDLVPDLRNGKEAGLPVLKCQRQGTDGWKIYSRINMEGQFTLVDMCMGSKYIDPRPKLDLGEKETREYYVYFVLDNQIVGQKSNVVSITI